jgi:hypothetical protein
VAPGTNGAFYSFYQPYGGSSWVSDGSVGVGSAQDFTGPSSTQPLASDPAIAFTGSNLVLTAVRQMSSSTQRLDYWWQGTTFTNFNFDKVATTTSPKA